ncbi:hypothetical protein HK101_006228 [Irineochytrium annulatum]|nr:hypothetical protein HK101_006228 [Irineochytrium annulatum]
MRLEDVESQLKASAAAAQQQLPAASFTNGNHPTSPSLSSTTTSTADAAASAAAQQHQQHHQQQQHQQHQQQPPNPHDLIASHIYHVGYAQGLYSDLRVRIQVVPSSQTANQQQGNGASSVPPGSPATVSAASVGAANLQQIDGVIFKLHRLLAVRSPVLASLLGEPGDSYSGPLELVLPVADHNVTSEGLSVAFGHLYASYTHSILASSHQDNRPQRSLLLRGVLASANLLHLGDLASLATEMIRQDISRSSVLEYCQFSSQPDMGSSYSSWSAEIRDSVFAYLSRGVVRELLAEKGPIWGSSNRDSEQYRELVATFAELPFDWLKRVVESKDSFEVPSDMERHAFAKDVIALRAKNRGPTSHLIAGEENVLIAFGTNKPGASGITIVRKAPKQAQRSQHHHQNAMSQHHSLQPHNPAHQQQQGYVHSPHLHGQQLHQTMYGGAGIGGGGGGGGGDSVGVGPGIPMNGMGGGSNRGVNGYGGSERRVWKASS